MTLVEGHPGASTTQMPSRGLHFPGVHATSHPDKPAVIMGSAGTVVTFAKLDASANRIARVFRSIGLSVQDNVAVWMENRSELIEVAWGAHYAGLYYTLISTRLTAAEAAYIVRDSGATVIVISEGIPEVNVAALREACPDVRVLGVGISGESLGGLIARQSSEPLEDAVEGTDLLYSSGTTGRPKGIKRKFTGLPIGTTTVIGSLAEVVIGLGEDSVYLSPSPLYHAAPLRWSMDAMALGATVVIMEHFDAELTLQLIERHRVTHAQFVPTMLGRMVKLPSEVRAKHDLSSLKAVVHAAAPCPASVKHAILDWWGPIVHEYYAGTEGAGLCWIGPQDWLSHPGSVGRPLMGKVRIVGDDGLERPVGEEGMIFFSDGNEFAYHNDPDRTAAAHNELGWSTMGDVGRVNADGFLYLTDRASNMIITGGVNVYPQEAENLLTGHQKVLDVAVFGVPNEDFGEEVKAVVQPVPDIAGTPELAAELLAFCRANLADIKCPRSVDFRGTLPREPTGKLLKRLLRDEYWAARDTRI